MVVEKIKFQWKTISKAFKDMNKDSNTDGISRPELKFYLDHWGMKMSEKQFGEIYSMFDLDKDGIISFRDFSSAIGHEIHPGEGLYFRQDKKMSIKHQKCKHGNCWQATLGSGSYCALHLKLYLDSARSCCKYCFKR